MDRSPPRTVEGLAFQQDMRDPAIEHKAVLAAAVGDAKDEGPVAGTVIDKAVALATDRSRRDEVGVIDRAVDDDATLVGSQTLVVGHLAEHHAIGIHRGASAL